MRCTELESTLPCGRTYNMADTEATENSSNSHEGKEEDVKNGETTEQDKDSSDNDETKTESTQELTKPPELEKYWEAVNKHPSDFTGWTYLLQYVEQKNVISFYREAFDEFFKHYPYCYGYWKKYGDTERKHGNPDKAYQVYERGVKAIPLCPDLWIHYITFRMQDLIQDENRQEKVRELFDRAVAACGQDFRSDKLWDYYIKFEKQQKQFQRVTAIYDQLLQVPTQQLSQHFAKFKELINKNSPQDTLSLDEFLKLRAEYVSTKENGDAEMEEEVKDSSVDDAPPGEERPPGEDSETSEEPSQGKDDTSDVTDVAPPGEDIKAKKELSDEEELEAIKGLAIKVREEIFQKTEEELKKRSKYEELIRRPYFHAKPLEKGQIKNWKEYLDFEVENGSKERTVLLFERCMIACALYEEMWLKYAKHLETVDEEAASEVYRRSCTIHLPKKPTLHLHWASFEESKGNVDVARKVLSDLEQSVPNLVSVMLERINLERRQKKYTRVTAMYKQHIENSAKPDHLTFFASKLACFLQKVVGDLDAAREVLENAVEKKGIPEVLYMKLIDLEYQRNPIDEEQTFKVFQQILEKDIPLETKIIFSKRKLEFTRDFSQDVRRLQSAAEDHSKLLKLHQNSLKKRKHSGEGDESDSKKPKATSEIKPEVLPPTPPANYSQPAPTASFQQPQYSQSFQPHQPHMDQSQTYNYQQSWSNYQNPYSGYQQHQQQHQQWGNYGTGYYPS